MVVFKEAIKSKLFILRKKSLEIIFENFLRFMGPNVYFAQRSRGRLTYNLSLEINRRNFLPPK